MSDRGLQPAGVNLQAKGFQEYIRTLDKVNKAQRKAFDDSGLKDLGISYSKATSAAKKYETQLRRQLKAEQKAQREQVKLAENLKKTQKAQTGFSNALKGTLIGVFTKQTAQAVFELGKLGATFATQEASLNNLAASFGQSGREIVNSIVAASGGTLSELKAIQAANEALLLGVAKTPEEFDRFTRAALVLGRTVGLSASESITRFTTALGRESLLRLDDFGTKAAEVNAEIERLAQSEFGKLPDQLSKAEKSAVFVEAALLASGENVDKIGEEAGNAVESFQQIEAAAENAKVSFGLLVTDLNEASGFSEGLASFLEEVSKNFQAARGDLGFGGTSEEIASTERQIQRLNNELIKLGAGKEAGFLTNLFDQINVLSDREENIAAIREEIAKLEGELSGLEQQREDEEQALIDTTKATDDNTEAVKENEEALKAAQRAIQQAEQIQLNFARAAEDAARKLERSQTKLAVKQAKARTKLLERQQKQLDEFEADRIKQIQDAEKELAKVRADTGKKQRKAQQDLQRQLRQDRERFNLDRLQSERRFNLAQTRLIAEGDILALQQLREDFDLEQKESAENFALSQKQQKENGLEQLKELEEETREREKELEGRLADLKVNLEKERGVLLAGFDNQLAELEISQAEQRQALLDAHAEQQEDARINQARQLEDLGRSLADQKDITAEGAMAVAQEIEGVFGEDGVADAIFKGFTERTESDFRDLFDNIGTTLAGVNVGIGSGNLPNLPTQQALEGDEFNEGGTVGGGPVGAPRNINAHVGETVLPTHKMSLPAALQQVLNVNVGGTIDVTGAENASAGVVDMTIERMLDSMEMAVTRMVRRG